MNRKRKYERKKREEYHKFKGENYGSVAENFSWIFDKLLEDQVSEKSTQQMLSQFLIKMNSIFRLSDKFWIMKMDHNTCLRKTFFLFEIFAEIMAFVTMTSPCHIRLIQNSAKHLRWTILRKWSTAKSC